MLELPKLGHMTTSTISFGPRDKILLVSSWTAILVSQPYFRNMLFLSMLEGANFANITRIAITFIKTAFKSPIKVKRIKIMY